jgi:multidrug resistance efflux pump
MAFYAKTPEQERKMEAEHLQRMREFDRLASLRTPRDIEIAKRNAERMASLMGSTASGARRMTPADRERLDVERAIASAKKPVKKRSTAAEKRAEKARLEAEKAKAEEDARLAENAGKLVKQVMRITKKALADGRITKSVKVRVNKCVKKIV